MTLDFGQRARPKETPIGLIAAVVAGVLVAVEAGT